MEYQLKKSFHIDHGELGDAPQSQCFVLGYELGQIDTKLGSPVGFACYVHVENRERVEESCRDANRAFSLIWNPADNSESWLWLVVQPVATWVQP